MVVTSGSETCPAVRDLLHEASTPLMAAVAALDLAPPSPEVAAAATALSHLHQLFSRAGGGLLYATSSPGTVPLGEIMSEVSALVLPELVAHDVGLRVEIAGLSAVADPLGLRQILVNLISNASRFAPAGSTVEVSARVVGDTVELEVCDYGSGIDAEAAAEVFGRGVTTGETGGHAGLGLFLSQQLAHSMGATLELRPSDIGTRFCVCLPVLRA